MDATIYAMENFHWTDVDGRYREGVRPVLDAEGQKVPATFAQVEAPAPVAMTEDFLRRLMALGR